MTSHRPSQQDIAKVLGVSKMTVSLALRNDPRIPAATRERIVEQADRMGYHPHPFISALMSDLRSRRSGAGAAVLAYITSHARSRDWQTSTTYSKFHDGAAARAEELGYRLEEFVLSGREAGATRLTQVLWNRNIRGLILAPAPHVTEAFGLDWSRFAVASLGYSITGLACHRVACHHKQTSMEVLERLWQCGYRRIGLVLHRGDNARVDYNWLAGYDIFQRLQAPRQSVPVLLVNNWSKRQFNRWFDQHRPDAIASLQPELAHWLTERGYVLGKDVGFAHLGLHPEVCPFSGMDQHGRVIGATAVDVVAEELNHNRVGIPEHPRLISIQSTWRDGTSTRKLSLRK